MSLRISGISEQPVPEIAARKQVGVQADHFVAGGTQMVPQRRRYSLYGQSRFMLVNYSCSKTTTWTKRCREISGC